MTGHPDDRGAGTILMLGLCLAAIALTAAAGVVGAAVVARHRAQAAADLAALGQAQALQRQLTSGFPAGAAGQCPIAATLAVRNGARLTSCRIEPATGIVDVSVAVPMYPPFAGAGRLGAGLAVSHARAGPASTPARPTSTLPLPPPRAGPAGPARKAESGNTFGA